MAKCASCSAELIGSAKFCAACGAPAQVRPKAAPVDPASAAAGATAAQRTPEPGGYAGPAAGAVNPFAATASPVSKHSITPAPLPRPSSFPGIGPSDPAGGASSAGTASDRKSVPPGKYPAIPAPGTEGSNVSPLAVSSGVSQHGAFQHAVESAKDKVRAITPPPAPARAKKPGTQLMPTAPNRPLPAVPNAAPPSVPPPAEASAAAKKAPPRTVAMSFGGVVGLSGPQSAVPSTTQSAGQSAGNTPETSGAHGASASGAAHGHPASPGAPAGQSALHAAGPVSAATYGQPQSVATPYGAPAGAAYGAPVASQQTPSAATPYGSAAYSGAGAAAPHPAQAYGHAHGAPLAGGWTPGGVPQGFPHSAGYAPGMRVHVTWSNGQRYPATVNQRSGTQCLVVFPDGQQHWVDATYLSPS